MLRSVLQKKSLLFIAIFLGITSIFAIASSFYKAPTAQPQTEMQSTTQKPAPIQTLTDPPSRSFSYADSDDLKRIFFTRDILRETTSHLTCQVRGIEPINPSVDCLTELSKANPDLSKFKNAGLLLFASNAVGSLYTQPASAIDYTTSLANNFGIQKAEAQNQGTGFNSLSQVQEIWIIIRNIVYLLILIVFIVIGVAIMLRINIDPRTVMTIQNQIPKAIIAIILITFSYSIAGLLVDAMWVGTYFGVNVLTETQPNCKVEGTEKTLTSVVTRDLLNNPIGFTTNILGDETGCQGTIDGISGLAMTVGGTFGDVVSRGAMVVFGLDEDLGDCGIGVSLPIVGKVFGDGNAENCIKIALYSILKYLIAIIAFLVVFLAIMVALFRVWFTLLKAYVFLIIDIILGPFWILLGLVPGSSLTFMSWARNILAQLAIFPSVILLLILASMFARNPEISNPGTNVFLPPLIGNPNIADNLGALIAFGFILLAPDIGNIVREALKSPASKQTGGITALAGFASGKVMGSFKGTEERISKRNDTMLEKGGARRGLIRIPFIDKKIG